MSKFSKTVRGNLHKYIKSGLIQPDTFNQLVAKFGEENLSKLKWRDFEFLLKNPEDMILWNDFRGSHISKKAPPEWMRVMDPPDPLFTGNMSRETLWLLVNNISQEDAWNSLKYLACCGMLKARDTPTFQAYPLEGLRIIYDSQPYFDDGKLIIIEINDDRECRIDWHYHK